MKDLPAPPAANQLILNDSESGTPFALPAHREGIIGEPTDIVFDNSIVTPRAPDRVLPGVRMRRRLHVVR